MVDLSNIDTIIFDLGGVIVDLDPDGVIMKLSEYVEVSPSEEMRDLIVNSPILIQYETGKTSEEEFLFEMNQLLGGSMNMQQFVEAWNIMLKDIPTKRLALMRQLSDRYQTMILSNTNGIHELKFDEIVNELTNEEGMHSFVNVAHYSHKIGLRKPEAACYQYVLDEGQLNPERTLFLDDNVKNISSANEMGIQSVRVEYPDQIFEILSDA